MHYTYDEANDWMPNLGDIRVKITPNTKDIVVINPNNPIGALYSDELLLDIVAIAREHGLVIFASEVYNRALFGDNKHTTIGPLLEGVLTVTFNSLSKNYRSCGYCMGWMIVSGDKRPAEDYIEGLNIFSPIHLRANMPGQWVTQTALGGYQSTKGLVAPGGRVCHQRDLTHKLVMAVPGAMRVKPKAALYTLPRPGSAVYPIRDDQTFICQLLGEERVLLAQGTGFNWRSPGHSRIVFLPHEDGLREAIGQIARFLERYR